VVHPLKNILNRFRWDNRENPDDYLITYRHRGAPNDEKRVKASSIQILGKSSFTLSGENEEETTIPFHRILEIRNVTDGRLLWRKRKTD
jgi:uncharacterized protein (UPF0248 family)